MDKKCSVEGCDKPPKGRGICNMHYNRWLKEIGRIPRSRAKEPEEKLPLDMSNLGQPINNEQDCCLLILAIIANAVDGLTRKGRNMLLMGYEIHDPRLHLKVYRESIDFIFSDDCYLPAFNCTSKELIEHVDLDLEALRSRARELIPENGLNKDEIEEVA